jgi:hypothetical protein
MSQAIASKFNETLLNGVSKDEERDAGCICEFTRILWETRRKIQGKCAPPAAKEGVKRMSK